MTYFQISPTKLKHSFVFYFQFSEGNVEVNMEINMNKTGNGEDNKFLDRATEFSVIWNYRFIFCSKKYNSLTRLFSKRTIKKLIK